jgi:hypothetical protein
MRFHPFLIVLDHQLHGPDVRYADPNHLEPAESLKSYPLSSSGWPFHFHAFVGTPSRCCNIAYPV